MLGAPMTLATMALGLATFAARPSARTASAVAEVEPASPPHPIARAGRSSDGERRARLVARARSLLGRRGPFRVRGERFNGDCSGYVEAVYAAEGLALRDLMARAAPDQRSAVKAAWLAARRHGRTFGAEATPGPGDLVFWHDTYDRNRNRRADDRFTHVGIVERVEGGAVHFLHRGGRGVARGVMTLRRSHDASSPDGRLLNSTLRSRSHPLKRGGLAAELFAGYGRLDLVAMTREDATAAVAMQRHRVAGRSGR